MRVADLGEFAVDTTESQLSDRTYKLIPPNSTKYIQNKFSLAIFDELHGLRHIHLILG